MKQILFLTLILMLSALIKGQGNWQYVPADHPAIHYMGRFDFSNPAAVRYDWPGSTILFQFTGNQLQLFLEGGERNYFNLFVNDELKEVIHVPSDSLYIVTGIKGKGPHLLRLQKRTEGEMGCTVFKGFNISVKGKVTPAPAGISRKIEFIGNSITCGYGTEGASREERFSPATENVNKSYAFITARSFGAECTVIAHSGLGVVRNYGDKNKVSTNLPAMPDRYHQVMDEDSLLKWDFNAWQPNAVVINLGTNDYSVGPQPDKAIFQRRYEEFIREIRAVYGPVPIFCICGPMRDEPAYSNIKEVVETSRLIYQDRNLYFIGIPTALLNDTSDLGSDWHPSYAGQLKMAAHIIPTLATVLNWSFSDVEWHPSE